MSEPGLLALLPAVVAIGLALTTRQVLVALVGGVFTGTILTHGFLDAPAASLDVFVATLADKDKLKVVSFTLIMGGLVGLAAAGGGTKGVVNVVTKFATTPRRGALASWAMGIFVFFDDYASTLLVGNTMRPITDDLKISREKLAYIVDSTAAPIASLALVSTWIGYEVSVLGEAMKSAGVEGEAYSVFLAGLPSRFYPILALFFVVMVAVQRRDFGPMLRAERRARHTGAVIREGAQPLVDASLVDDQEELANTVPRAAVAIVPIVVLIATVVAVLAVKGSDASYDALMYGAGAGAVVGFVLVLATRALNVHQSVDAFVRGVRAMTMAVMVLALAWTIGKVMGDLKAGEAVANLIGTSIPGWSLPTVTFLLAAVMAFSTGTSWGTMAILFPIVLPVIAVHTGQPDFESLLLASTSAVLAGAVFGDHCSPISDTTVLSSIASASDHVDHTRTQAPYAILVGVVSIVFGTIPTGFGISPYPCLIVGALVLWAFLRVVGKNVDDVDDASATHP